MYKTKTTNLHLYICSLSRTLGPSSPVLVELPNIRSRAFNLFQTDIGGDDFTSKGDGDKDTFKMDAGL